MIPVLSLITIISLSDLLHSRGLSEPTGRRSILPPGAWRPWLLGAVVLGLTGLVALSSPWWTAVGVVAGAGVWLSTYLNTSRGPAMVIAGVIALGLLAPFALTDQPPLTPRWDIFQKVLLVISVIGLNLTTANRIVRAVLRLAGASEPATNSNEPRAGRVIGVLERLLLVALVIAGQGISIAGVAAAKSIIRYPEISKAARDEGGLSAEVFFIGTVTSWLVALVAPCLVWLTL